MSRVVLGEHTFRSLTQIFYDLTGITLDTTKRSLVASRVARRLRATGLDEIDKYLDLLDGPRKDNDEVTAFIDALTTHKTSFFRTRSVWSFLEEEVRKRFEEGEEIRAWSAACSSGREPYSLAMLLESQRTIRGQWHVTASDVSAPMVERTRCGVFDHDALPSREDVPCSLDPADYFKRSNEGLKASSALISRMSFLMHNLMCIPKDRYDIILLRNVIIYFSESDRDLVINNCIAALRPDGLLVLGEAESLTADDSTLDYEAPCIYRLNS